MGGDIRNLQPPTRSIVDGKPPERGATPYVPLVYYARYAIGTP
jgi:hypothetical protein